MKCIQRSFLIVCIAGFTVEPVLATPFTIGNILVSTDAVIYEYTPTGIQVQSVPVPELPDTAFTTGKARDIIVHPNGQWLVFNGTFGPNMSTFDPVGATWTHETFDDWETVGNISYGGIATDGPFVYVCDSTASGSNPGGVVRFDRQGGPTIRSAVSRDAHDLALGLDGYLYTLSRNTVSKFAPVTMEHLGDVYIGGDHWGLAVDYDGSMFVVSGGQLNHRASDGTYLDQLTLPNAGTLTSYHMDVDLLRDGSILVGQRWGSIVQTDRDFSSVSVFQGPTGLPTFVAFTTPAPEPSTLALAALGWIGLVAFGRRWRSSPAYR